MKAELIGYPQFIARLTERYPEIAASVDECSRGLLHCEMGTVARVTQAAIDAGDKETLRQHFAFIDEVFQNAAPDVENAIYVSYLENLWFDGCEGESMHARPLLPPRLQQALMDLEAHWEKINSQKTFELTYNRPA